MHLSHLSLTNFRGFARLDMDIPRRVVLLTGNNAQGKTSILEAIYYLAALTSFQTYADRQMVNFIEARKDLAVSRLVAEFTSGLSKHRLEVRLVLEAVGATGQRLRKEILLDGVKLPQADAVGHFNAVIFVAQMTGIIEGGPEGRRRYMNLALVQSVAGYARKLDAYAEALTQRNALLKILAEHGGDPSQLEYWEDVITRNGAGIILSRIRAIQEIEKLAARIHRDLTQETEILRLNYQPAYDPLPRPQGQIMLPMTTPAQRDGFSEEEIRNGFLEALRQNRAEEIRRGMTLLGPHRDELRFLANGVDLSDYGSRGQVRTTLLALKLAEVEWLKSRTGQWPVLLLDEVLVELDDKRRLDLLRYLDRIEQAVLTTTDMKLFAPEFVNKAEVWQVEGGKVNRMKDGNKE